MNVDQLRLNIEQLPPAAQDLSYYEKWSVAMLNHLRRSPEVIDPASYRRFVDLSASSPEASDGGEPRFRPGDRVIVREQGRFERMAILYHYGLYGVCKKGPAEYGEESPVNVQADGLCTGVNDNFIKHL